MRKRRNIPRSRSTLFYLAHLGSLYRKHHATAEETLQSYLTYVHQRSADLGLGVNIASLMPDLLQTCGVSHYNDIKLIRRLEAELVKDNLHGAAQILIQHTDSEQPL